METVFDAIVVGAGPAGVSAAVHLVRAGLSVALLDKARFPRDKTCGDGVSAAAQECLEKLGVLDRVEALAPALVSRMRLFGPDGGGMTASPASSGGRSRAMVLRRKDLDHALFSFAAERPGITAMEGFRASGLRWEGGAACGVEGVLDGRPAVVKGRSVVGADGIFSAVASSLGLSFARPGTRPLGLRAYFTGVLHPEDSYTQIFTRELLPGYAWIFPLGGGVANVGVWTTTQRLSRAAIRDIFHGLSSAHPELSSALARAEMVPDSRKARPLAAGAPNALRGRVNVLLAGDAGDFSDPATGEGIFQALASGELAARAVILAASGPEGFSGAACHYERLWRRRFRGKLLLSGLILRHVLARPALAGAAFRAARALPGVSAGAASAFSSLRKR